MAEQFIKLSETKSITTLSGSSLYRMAAAGLFPKPIKIGIRSSAWRRSEVEQWMEDRIAASRSEEAA